MAELTGKGGSVTFTNCQTSAKSWSLSWSSDNAEITDFADGSAGYKKRLPTLKDWSATVEYNYDAANTASPGDSATLTLNVNATINYSGSALIDTITPSVDVNGVASMTVAFSGNGALTPTYS